MTPPPVPEAEWTQRTRADRDIKEAILDPVWRIANIYTIFDKRVKAFVPFRPKPEQRRIIWDIFVLGIKNIIIPKARQIGFSTLLALIAVDFTIFNGGTKSALIDKTKIDAEAKFNDTVRVAWEKLPDSFRRQFDTPTLNSREFAVQRKNDKDDGLSSFRVTKSGRGSPLVFLWISEWGTIQFEEPKRSLEILTGGMPAADGGIRVIETTWKGGEGGDVWVFVEQALKKADDQKNPANDWFIRFFPWWVEPSYTEPGTGDHIRREIHEYLDNKELEISGELGRQFRFTLGQRCWYDKQESILKLFIKREYPTTLQECWEAPVDDAIYAAEYARALSEGRVRRDLHDPEQPVYTCWDLGGPATMVCWYFQILPHRLRWIDCDMNLFVTTSERVQRMKAKPYRYAKHFIPHDGEQTERSAMTFHGDLVQAGLDNVVVVPRTDDMELGINKTLELFPHMEFDATRTAEASKAIKAYHRHKETKEPVHDWSSHPCDGMRTGAEAAAAGLVNMDAVLIPSHEHLQYFDPEALSFYDARCVLWEGKRAWGVLQHGAWIKGQPDTSWLRVWEEPVEGQSYLVTAVRGALAGEGWAVAAWRKGRDGVPVMAAAIKPGIEADMDIASSYITAMSLYYGRALVVPVIDDTIGLVAMLTRDRAGPVWMREDVEEKQAIGKSKRARKPGYELKDAARMQILASLKARMREHSMEIGCVATIGQMRTFIQLKPGSAPMPAAGHGQAWVIQAALAAHCIGSAILYSAPPVPEIDTGGRGHYVREMEWTDAGS